MRTLASRLKYATFPALAMTLSAGGLARAEEFPTDAAAGLDPSLGIAQSEKDETEREPVALGGSLKFAGSTMFEKGKPMADASLHSGTDANLYLDAHLRDRTRSLFRGRIRQDSANPSATFSVEEAKLQSDWRERVFFTLGRQKIKFGSGHFWNPTDFLNAVSRDPFSREDSRTGIDMLKANVPLGANNLMAGLITTNTARLHDLGLFARTEIAVSPAEISLTALSVRGKKTRLGIDASSALGDLDIFIESGITRGSDKIFLHETGQQISPFAPEKFDKRWFHRTSAGITYEIKYSDTDSATVGIEYFYNGEGYEKRETEAAALAAGASLPLDLGKHYTGLFVNFAKPSNWSDGVFTIVGLANISDRSGVIRPELAYNVTRPLTFTLAVPIYGGHKSGEFTAGNKKFALEASLEAIF